MSYSKMNKTIANFAREEIKRGLSKATETQRYFFKRMYSHNDLNKPINAVVDDMPEAKLDWALTQIENTKVKETKK